MKWPISILLISLLSAAPSQAAATGTSLLLSSTATNLTPGQGATLSCAVVSPSGASAPCSSPWYADNAGGTIVSVSGATITGFSVGSVTVSVNANGLSATLPVKVVPASQEDLGVVTASQLVQGLGFNVTPQNDWEFALAAAAGATHVRFQCGWGTAEAQTAPPLNTVGAPRYALQDYCTSALQSAKKYGLHTTVLAAYGAPYHQILSVMVPGGAAAGATTLNVQFSSGVNGDTLTSLKPISDTLINSDGYTFLSPKHSYAGSLITAVTLRDATHATITLASALSSPLPASSSAVYTVNEYLYAPPANSSPNDLSVQAFASYAKFLAQSISSTGLSGEVELWNEAPWPDDAWDNRLDFYDTPPPLPSPGPTSQWIPNWGFAAALQSQPVPVGVTYLWGGTEKSGTNSLLNPGMAANTGSALLEPSGSITSESFHPYGNNPEDGLWSAPCLANSTGNNDFFSCNLFGGPGGNFSLAAQYSVLQQRKNPAFGVHHNITETGFSLGQGDAAHQARFAMRQFLGFQAAGVTPIEFYRLYDTSSEQLGFVNSATQQPLPAYTALAGLMKDLAGIQSAPISSFSASSLARVSSYSGAFPLDTVHIVGTRSGDAQNSELLAVWQRSFVTPGSHWATSAQPASALVTVTLPSGMTVSKVTNLDTRASVPFTPSGQQVTFPVSDDPIGLLMVPGAATPVPATISLSGLQQTFTGQPIAASVSTTPGGLSYAISYAGSATPPTMAGTYNVIATITAEGFQAGSINGQLSIAQASPSLSWSPSTQTLVAGVPVGGGILDATSTSAGSFSYSATATSGTTLPLTPGALPPAGNYTLNALFTPADMKDFTSATVTTPLEIVSVGTLFVADSSGQMSVVSQAGGQIAPAITGGGIGAVVDPSANVWSIDANGGGISKFSSEGALLKNFKNLGIAGARSLATDAAGTLWFVERRGTLQAISNTGSLLAGVGITSAQLNSPTSVIVDASGSLWVTNAASNSVTEIFGMAALEPAPSIDSIGTSKVKERKHR